MHALVGLPEKLIDHIRAAAVVEYATVSAAGVPIDTPTLCFPSSDLSSLDVGTGLAYPAKAERTHKLAEITSAFDVLEGQAVTVAGRVTGIR